MSIIYNWHMDTPGQLEEARKAASYIHSIIKAVPDIAVILGSGLGSLADAVPDAVTIDYGMIPGFLESTVPGHEGRLISGIMSGKRVLFMKGRFHYYEGHDIRKVVFPIRAFGTLGIKNLIITNAAGGVNTGFEPGDLMLITDHLGFNVPSPLRGRNHDEFGERFPDMSSCYDGKLINMAEGCAGTLGFNIKKGIYSYSQGPMFETPAEIKALRILGADAVGMSTVPEAIIARHMGMRILAISCITNMAAGVLHQPLTHSEVLETAKLVGKKFSDYILKIIERWLI